jgi:hypothetical protein
MRCWSLRAGAAQRADALERMQRRSTAEIAEDFLSQGVVYHLTADYRTQATCLFFSALEGSPERKWFGSANGFGLEPIHPWREMEELRRSELFPVPRLIEPTAQPNPSSTARI